MRMLMIAAAAAAGLLTVSVGGHSDAFAAGAKAAKTAKAAKPAKAAKAKAVKVVKAAKAAPKAKAAAKKKGPGTCGTYWYWKGNKCMDARLKR